MHYLAYSGSGMNQNSAFRQQGPAGGPRDVEGFLAAVGLRVRQARRARGMSRRMLSDLSRVSQRYLAQLENGSGNVSIALLYRIACALDHPVERLLGAGDGPDAEALEVARRFRAADAPTRRRVLELLERGGPAAARARRICLIGLRGAGKSTLGRMAGEALDIPFLELNRAIEDESGMPVAEVMALYGQEGYRALERQALERVAATTREVVLAIAGGIVSEPETYRFLLEHFHTIWLKATPEEHMRRVRAQGDERPMAGNPKAMEELVSILTSREALYARADAMVGTSGKTIEESLRDVLDTIAGLGFLAQPA